MKKNSIILIALGALLLAIGAVMSLTGGPPAADAALAQSCEQKMTAQGADAGLVAQCKETAFATAMTATDADVAARAISAANNGEIGGGMIAMFLIGVGLALVAGGIVVGLKKKDTIPAA